MKKTIYIFLLNFLFFTNLNALIEVDITRGNLDPLPIAVSPLHVDISSENFKDLNLKISLDIIFGINTLNNVALKRFIPPNGIAITSMF